MATKKDVEPKKDAGTGEKSIEYIVDGVTEDELKKVSGGLGGVGNAKVLTCAGHECHDVKLCAYYCSSQICPEVTCSDHRCSSFRQG